MKFVFSIAIKVLNTFSRVLQRGEATREVDRTREKLQASDWRPQMKPEMYQIKLKVNQKAFFSAKYSRKF